MMISDYFRNFPMRASQPLSPPPNFHQVANPQWVSDFYYARVPKLIEFLPEYDKYGRGDMAGFLMG